MLDVPRRAAIMLIAVFMSFGLARTGAAFATEPEGTSPPMAEQVVDAIADELRTSSFTSELESARRALERRDFIPGWEIWPDVHAFMARDENRAAVRAVLETRLADVRTFSVAGQAARLLDQRDLVVAAARARLIENPVDAEALLELAFDLAADDPAAAAGVMLRAGDATAWGEIPWRRRLAEEEAPVRATLEDMRRETGAKAATCRWLRSVDRRRTLQLAGPEDENAWIGKMLRSLESGHTMTADDLGFGGALQRVTDDPKTSELHWRVIDAYRDLLRVAATEPRWRRRAVGRIMVLENLDGLPNENLLPALAHLATDLDELNTWRRSEIHATTLGHPLAFHLARRSVAGAGPGLAEIIDRATADDPDGALGSAIRVLRVPPNELPAMLRELAFPDRRNIEGEEIEDRLRVLRDLCVARGAARIFEGFLIDAAVTAVADGTARGPRGKAIAGALASRGKLGTGGVRIRSFGISGDAATDRIRRLGEAISLIDEVDGTMLGLIAADLPVNEWTIRLVSSYPASVLPRSLRERIEERAARYGGWGPPACVLADGPDFDPLVLPEGLRWTSVLHAAVDTQQNGYRYVGGTNRWVRPSTGALGHVLISALSRNDARRAEQAAVEGMDALERLAAKPASSVAELVAAVVAEPDDERLSAWLATHADGPVATTRAWLARWAAADDDAFKAARSRRVSQQRRDRIGSAEDEPGKEALVRFATPFVDGELPAAILRVAARALNQERAWGEADPVEMDAAVLRLWADRRELGDMQRIRNLDRLEHASGIRPFAVEESWEGRGLLRSREGVDVVALVPAIIRDGVGGLADASLGAATISTMSALRSHVVSVPLARRADALDRLMDEFTHVGESRLEEIRVVVPATTLTPDEARAWAARHGRPDPMPALADLLDDEMVSPVSRMRLLTAIADFGNHGFVLEWAVTPEVTTAAMDLAASWCADRSQRGLPADRFNHPAAPSWSLFTTIVEWASIHSGDARVTDAAVRNAPVLVDAAVAIHETSGEESGLWFTPRNAAIDLAVRAQRPDLLGRLVPTISEPDRAARLGLVLGLIAAGESPETLPLIGDGSWIAEMSMSGRTCWYETLPARVDALVDAGSIAPSVGTLLLARAIEQGRPARRIRDGYPVKRWGELGRRSHAVRVGQWARHEARMDDLVARVSGGAGDATRLVSSAMLPLATDRRTFAAIRPRFDELWSDDDLFEALAAESRSQDVRTRLVIAMLEGAWRDGDIQRWVRLTERVLDDAEAERDSLWGEAALRLARIPMTASSAGSADLDTLIEVVGPLRDLVHRASRPTSISLTARFEAWRIVSAAAEGVAMPPPPDDSLDPLRPRDDVSMLGDDGMRRARAFLAELHGVGRELDLEARIAIIREARTRLAPVAAANDGRYGSRFWLDNELFFDPSLVDPRELLGAASVLVDEADRPIDAHGWALSDLIRESPDDPLVDEAIEALEARAGTEPAGRLALASIYARIGMIDRSEAVLPPADGMSEAQVRARDSIVRAIERRRTREKARTGG